MTHPAAPALKSPVHFRLACEADVPGILHVQRERYPAPLQERADVMRARLLVARHTSWVAVHDNSVVGYLLAYPSLLGRVTPLNGAFSPAREPDTLYLHDLAVSASGAGCRVGRSLVNLALQAAARMRIRYASLVAIPGADTYWRSYGFRSSEETGQSQPRAFGDYPPGTCYMIRSS